MMTTVSRDAGLPDSTAAPQARGQAQARPAALQWSMDNCTVARTMAVLGERSTVLVLREVVNGIRRFDEMREHTGIPRQVLTKRLAMLVRQGVLRRAPYQLPGERLRHEYRLTDKGFDLYPVLVAMQEWGDRYLADPEGSPVQMAHRGCEAVVSARLRCADGHDISDYRQVVTRPGPGARRVGE
jgi:DNA-binding HxlR family transcriptional regulator